MHRDSRKFFNSDSSSFNQYIKEKLKDPELARQYVSEAIETNDSEYLKVAIGDIVRGYGTRYISEKSGVRCEEVEKILSEDRDITYYELVTVIDALELRLEARISNSNCCD